MIIFPKQLKLFTDPATVLNTLANKKYYTKSSTIEEIYSSMTSNHINATDFELVFFGKPVSKNAFSQFCRLINSYAHYLSKRTDYNLLEEDLAHDIELIDKNAIKSLLFSDTSLCAVNGENFPRIPNHSLLTGIITHISTLPNIDTDNVKVSLHDEEMIVYLKYKHPLSDNTVPVIKISHSEAGTGPLTIEAYLSYNGLGLIQISETKNLLRKCHIGSMKTALDTLKITLTNFETHTQYISIDPRLTSAIQRVCNVQLWSSLNEAEKVIDTYFNDSYIADLLKSNIQTVCTVKEFVGLYAHTIESNGLEEHIILNKDSQLFLKNLMHGSI